MHVQVLNDPLKLGPTQLGVDGKAAASEEGAGGHTWRSGGVSGSPRWPCWGPGVGEGQEGWGRLWAGPCRDSLMPVSLRL